jgi:hypothetical protein
MLSNECLVGIVRGLLAVLSLHLPGGTEEDHIREIGVLAEFQTLHLPDSRHKF